MKHVMMLVVLAMFAFSCEKDQNELSSAKDENYSAKLAEGCASPTGSTNFLNANPNCESAGNYSFDYSTGNINVVIVDGVRQWDADFPEGFTVELSADGRQFSWSYADPNGVYCLAGLTVLVKGGPNATLYTYEGNVSCGGNLTAPVNKGRNIPAVSHVSLCYSLEECGDVCYTDETAWTADGNAPGTRRYQDPGNWATYTSYHGVEKTVNIYSGQTNLAGTATFSAPVDGMVNITISLAADHLLEDDAEPIKVQDYASAPSGNPAPGGFAHKTYVQVGSDYVISVPVNNFYGVHLDVLREVDCD